MDAADFACARCGSPGARFATYAGFLCAACNAALPKACDFCSRRPPAWRFPGAAFEYADGLAHVDADWLACMRCHRLIIAGRHVALCDLAVRAFLRQVPGARRDRAAIWRLFADFHNAFRAHRRGDPYRVDH